MPTSAKRVHAVPGMRLECVVFLVGYRFEPFVRRILTRHRECKMGKPAVGCSPMPVLDTGGNMDYCSWQNFLRLLAFFLIPSATGHAHEHLTTAIVGMMYVPIIAATGLECDIGKRNLSVGHLREITVPYEIFGISSVWLADRENHLTCEAFLFIGDIFIGIVPHFGSQTECAPCLWPPGIECHLSKDFGNLSAGHSVFLSLSEMVCER